jgi:hypothetical protein
MSVRFLPEVCRLIRGNAHNPFMASRTSRIYPVQSVRELPGQYVDAIYPTPLPLSSHAPENNRVTSKKAQTTCQNKELTSPSLSEIRRFAPGMPQFLGAGEAQMAETAIVSNHSCDCLASLA